MGPKLIENSSELLVCLQQMGVLLLCLLQVMMVGCGFLGAEEKLDAPRATWGKGREQEDRETRGARRGEGGRCAHCQEPCRLRPPSTAPPLGPLRTPHGRAICGMLPP